MGDYNITKIIDGLFVSDQVVPYDVPFLAGNKIIRVLGWTAEPADHRYQDEGIEEWALAKNISQVRFPSFCELQQGFAFLEGYQQQMLCGLIYGDSQLQGVLIGIMYLMRRFGWDCNSAYDFMRAKMEVFECSDQTIEELEKYQQFLEERNKIKLNHVLWEYQFLNGYASRSDEEGLIVTTMKNKLRKSLEEKEEKESKRGEKKKKKIRWQDQLRPSSALSVSSMKNLSRSSLLKGRLLSPTSCLTVISPTLQRQIANKDLELLYHSVGFKSSKLSRSHNQKQVSQKENGWQQSSQYLQLKEMSRTNFNDRRYLSSKVKRRSSLKPAGKAMAKQKGGNIGVVQSLVGIYGSKSGRGLSRVSSAQSFLTGLRAFNKVGDNNA